MRKLLFIFLLTIFLVACDDSTLPIETISTTIPDTTQIETTDTETTETEPTEATIPDTKPLHSPLYIDGFSADDVITYFSEVCLDAEFVNSGNAKVLQKWVQPIYYQVNGTPTKEDLETLNKFTSWLNTINGFPGISEADNDHKANLQIHFCTQSEMLTLMGDHFTNMDGAVTFWYRNSKIYDAIICYRTDIDQAVRNSVILEEIYNGLGPIQDTSLRQDSIIFSGYSAPQELTEIDELILKLLYNPQLRCGMDAQECAEIIRQLYY